MTKKPAKTAKAGGKAAPKGEMPPRQAQFVREYLIDLNATQAAIRAGYSEKTANEQGSRLLTNVSVRSAIDAALMERAERTQITADYVLTTIHDTVERCKQARPVVDRSGKPVLVETPDGSLLPAYTFEPQSVLKGAELLGKHLKLFTDKTEHTGPGGGDIAVKVDVTVSPSEGYLKMLGAGK